jgi:ribosomal protein S18 acetylase RimI-like enzyme
MIIRKILKEEFIKLKDLFPGNEELWIKYKEQRLKQFDNKEIDIYVIQDGEKFIGELTVNYISHDLKAETIPNIRVYFEAFRTDKKYQSKGLGQKLIEYTINDLNEKGFKEFTIGVEEDNEKAKHIYFKYGFTKAIDYGKGDEFDPTDYTLYLKK